MEERLPSSIRIVPKDYLSKIIFMGYRGPDERTAVFAVHSVSYSIYLSFLISNLIYFFSYSHFFNLNFAAGLSVALVATGWNFFKFGLDRSYQLDGVRAKRFFAEIILMPVFVMLLYFVFYVAARHDLTSTEFNIYLVYVLLHSLYVGVIALCFSHFATNLLRLFEGRRA